MLRLSLIQKLFDSNEKFILNFKQSNNTENINSKRKKGKVKLDVVVTSGKTERK